MSKYNDSMISLLDAVDKIFDTAQYSVQTSTSSAFSYPYGHYTYQYWEWPKVINYQLPKIDIPNYPVANGFIREDGSMYLSFAVTGYDKSELSIKAEDNTLVIEGKLKEKEDTSKWKELFHNLAIKDFIWKRRISSKYDLEKLEAKVEKGILEILIPLKEICKPIKKEFEIK
jgi:HSP20 family molecular chaperone IbpA